MAYELGLLPSALKECDKLAPIIREQFKKKLAELFVEPRVPAVRLSGARWIALALRANVRPARQLH
jgi:mRNA interferase RelE/StbE